MRAEEAIYKLQDFIDCGKAKLESVNNDESNKVITVLDEAVKITDALAAAIAGKELEVEL